MPKQQLIIKNFEGGLNTNSDARDIADNEFSALQGFDVDSLGRIRTMGTHGNHVSIPSIAIGGSFPGYGIFAYSTDFDKDGAGDLGSFTNIALSEGDFINIWNDSSNAWNYGSPQPIDLGGGDDTTTDVRATFYAPNGGLRVCDGEFSNWENIPKSFIHTPYLQLGKGTNSSYPTDNAEISAINSYWKDFDASIEKGVTSANLKMVNTGSKTHGFIEWSEGDTNNLDASVVHSGDTPGTVQLDTGIDYGGALSAVADIFNGYTCSFNRDGVTIYGVICDYSKSGGTGTFHIWTGPNGDSSPKADSVDHTEDWGFQVGQEDVAMWNDDLGGAGSDYRGAIQADWGVTLRFAEATATNGGTWMPESTTRYKFYHTTIFDEAQESQPALFTMYPTKAIANDDHEAVSEMFFGQSTQSVSTESVITPATNVGVNFSLLVRMRNKNIPEGGGSDVFTISSANYPTYPQDNPDEGSAFPYNFLPASGETNGNTRVKGGRVYWASSEDGFSNLYLLIDYDLTKGAIPVGSAGGTGAGGYSKWRSWEYPVAQNPFVIPDWTNDESTWYDPPILETYESLNGYPHDTKLNAKWKTAVVANGRVYIANIKRQRKSTFDGGGTWLGAGESSIYDPEYQDRIVKSPVGKFDTFPDAPGYTFELSSNDGDEIIKLETFADRLLVFGKYRLQIINIQRDTEILESVHPYLGLDGGNAGQAVDTGMGIAWVNSQGCYFYDGRNVQSLTDNKIRNMWVGEDEFDGSPFWLSDLSDVPGIAYDPKTKQIMCIKTLSAAGSDSEHILMYSLKTKAWTYKENALTNNKIKRFTVFRNELIFDNESRIQNWSNTPADGAGSGKNIIHTKDFDFGAPAIRKKIYKVHITYKTGVSSGTGITHVQVTYGVDGDSTPTESFTVPELPSTSSSADWHIATLKPTDSIKNAKSFRLAFNTDNNVPEGFEINDITIIYRMKNIK